MKAAVFSARDFDHQFLKEAADRHSLELAFFEAGLELKTVPLAAGFQAISIFCNDNANASTVAALAEQGTKLIALRGAGYNNVDLKACASHSVKVVRVPEYSPHAIAEHTFGLILAINRKIHKAYNRVREGNFALSGLMGFDLFGKTMGIIGTGRIGGCAAQIAAGFGMKVLMFDPVPDEQLKPFGEFTDLKTLLAGSDIVSLHCPLNEQTRHLIDADAIETMKPGVMLVNTGRGALIDTKTLINVLKSGRIGALAIDVYEEEAGMFFEDRSLSIMQDDLFARLLTFNNVLITGHQAFFTREALTEIAETTVASIIAWSRGETLVNEIAI